jgi:hypothetical protein
LKGETVDEAMIEFFGGPMDGQTLEAGRDPGFSGKLAPLVLAIIGSRINQAEREERKIENLISWQVPVADIVERAKNENWSAAKKAYYLKHHDYHIMKAVEHEGIVMLTAIYHGITPAD